MKTINITNSSQVTSIGYDADRKIFEVIFKTGAVYHYFDVSPELWEQAQKADSIGKFVAAHIKPHSYKLIQY